MRKYKYITVILHKTLVCKTGRWTGDIVVDAHIILQFLYFSNKCISLLGQWQRKGFVPIQHRHSDTVLGLGHENSWTKPTASQYLGLSPRQVSLL